MTPGFPRFGAVFFRELRAMEINVKADVSAALKKLKDFPLKQVPFAVASALTATATQTANLLTNKLPEYFDRPTPFTMRAIGTTRATKSQLQATVFVKPLQARYLAFGIEGGTRKPTKSAFPIPVDQPLDQYGNIGRRKISQLLKRKDVFVGKVNGIGGIWQRQGKRLVLLLRWASSATYRKRFPFFDLGTTTIREAFPPNFRIALANAMRTAR